MKTVKIDLEYYDKIKELADASGRTVVATVSSVLGAGLGELDDLGEAINNVQEHHGSVRPKIGNPVKQLAELEVQEDDQEEESPEANHSWVWIVGAVLAFAALRQGLLKAQANGALMDGR